MEDQLVGKYRTLRKLGEGGMGAVYAAVDEQIGRKVAIKVLHKEYAQNPHITARFFNEARAVNIIQHPGIVGIFEFGQLPDQTAYIVMEYLEGETLTKRLRRQRTLGDDALRLVRQVASALAAAHDKGVIHRDIKPDNVMIVPDPEAPGGERAKLLDFGIAKLLDQKDGPELKTKTGTLIGTPAYMSPEQCRGVGPVTVKADVYSLGILLYKMLSGNVPFRSEGAGEVMAQHMFSEPRPIQELVPKISPDLARLVHRMLSKSAADRPTMHQVAAALEALGAPRASQSMIAFPEPSQSEGLDLVTIPPTPPTTLGAAAGQSALQHGRRRRTAQLRAGLLLGALLLGSGGAWLIMSRGTQKAAQPARVHWSIRTWPTGAEVWRMDDGTLLGTTPLSLTVPAKEATVEIEVRHAGFASQRVVLDEQVSLDLEQRLVQSPAVTVEPLKTGAAAGADPAAGAGGGPASLPGSPGRDHGAIRGTGVKPPYRRSPGRRKGREVRDEEIEIVK